MKIFVLILIALVSSQAVARFDDPVSSAALFVDGFLRGALAKNVGRVDNCLTDGDRIIGDVGKVIKNLESGFNLLDLLKAIGNLLVDIPNSVKDCKELPSTVKTTFAGWEKKLKNPIEIAKIVFNALTKHRTQLVNDANNFLSQWKAGKFEASGQSLGDIPHTVFDLSQPKVPVAGVARFLDGFLRSALDREIGEVDQCLTDADNLVADIEKFITDIESGFDLMPIIADLGKFLTDIPNSIKDCAEFKDAVEQVFAAWEEEIKNPVEIAKIVYNALSQYQDRIKGDANDFITQWKAGDYEGSGQKLGDIPHVLFDLCALQETTTRKVRPLLSGN